MSNSSPNEWAKWAAFLFDGSDGAGQAVGEAWATWFKELHSERESKIIAEDWLKTAHKTGQHATEFVKRARAWLKDNQDPGGSETIDDLRARIERLEKLLPAHFDAGIDGVATGHPEPSSNDEGATT